MVETITETVFSQLSGALASLDALAQTYFAVQEENERVARFSKFDPNQAAFIAAWTTTINTALALSIQHCLPIWRLL